MIHLSTYDNKQTDKTKIQVHLFHSINSTLKTEMHINTPFWSILERFKVQTTLIQFKLFCCVTRPHKTLHQCCAKHHICSKTIPYRTPTTIKVVWCKNIRIHFIFYWLLCSVCVIALLFLRNISSF